MSKTLVYTFRTVDLQGAYGDNVFVFSKLRSDLKLFCELILKERPTSLLGIGNSSDTRYEAQAVNKFHGKTILRDGKPVYHLHIPVGQKVSDIATESFCNWTAYCIAHFIAENNLPLEHSFLHLAKVK